MSRFLFILVLIVAALLALAVTAMNPQQVALELAFIGTDAPVGLALVVAFAIGMLAGLGLRLRWMAQLVAERSRLRRALQQAESHGARRGAAGQASAQP